jgi:DNA-binding GntR family transcriptional regulator
MKHDTVYKRSFNEALDVLRSLSSGAPLPSENGLAQRLSVSRTTVRKILTELGTRGLVEHAGDHLRLARGPKPSDAFPTTETTQTAERVERLFLEWMLHGDLRPGDGISGLDLARQFGASPGAIREYLNRFARFGLIERRPNASWVFRGFTQDFALELFQVRELFETTSVQAFAALPSQAREWSVLLALKSEHEQLLHDIDDRFQDFSDLDDRFHRLLSSASHNRFFTDFQDVISLIFHYHYQWNKMDERDRNEAAAREHLVLVQALFGRDAAAIDAACRAHLSTARRTLLSSLLM